NNNNNNKASVHDEPTVIYTKPEFNADILIDSIQELKKLSNESLSKQQIMATYALHRIRNVINTYIKEEWFSILAKAGHKRTLDECHKLSNYLHTKIPQKSDILKHLPPK